MSSLQVRLSDLITAIGTDYKAITGWMFGTGGSLADLDTSDKTSLVAAINEAFAAVSGGGVTNLGATLSATQTVITSDTGTDATIPAADTTNAGVMTKAMFDKLAGIEASADVTDVGNIGSSVHGATAKTTPVGADEFLILDSAASFAAKRVTGSNFATYITGLIVDSAPGTLDTLNELAAAIGDDADFAGTMTTALAGKQALNSNLTSLSGLTLAANKGLYSTGVATLALFDLTAAGRAILDDADAAAQRATLSVYSTTELGDPDTNLASAYATAKA